MEPESITGNGYRPAYAARQPRRQEGDLSRFVEEAVNREVLREIVRDIQARNANADPEEVERLVDEELNEMRHSLQAQEPR
ncbi:MAG: ribbon-helix-helix domain-containing protein [Sphingomonadales bacterium]